jgi:hypothetical protein
VKQTEKVFGLALPANSESPPPFEPRKQPFDLPAASIPPERPPILFAPTRSLSLTPWGDKFHTAFREELLLQLLAVPSLVADQSGRQFVHESSVERSFGENDVVS